MTNKTISINPALFVVGAKTKKNRAKDKAPKITPLISPNVLKNKLMKRIKEHKQRELQMQGAASKKKADSVVSQPLNNYANEFQQSISYIKSLVDAKKARLANTTLKRHTPFTSAANALNVNIDLPDALKEVSGGSFEPSPNSTVITLRPADDIPYGILKGGEKPTYREYMGKIHASPNMALTVSNSAKPKNNFTIKANRTERLQALRKKLELEEQRTNSLLNNAVSNTALSTNSSTAPLPFASSLFDNNNITQPIQQAGNIREGSEFVFEHGQDGGTSTVKTAHVELPAGDKIIGTKRITKKTIRRKYTLGKSHIKKSVSVLVKDRGTRKKITDAQKELKRKPITEIKTYLRNHNLIKLGSTAPNDVLRKIYESAMLAGEITNNNTETMLHNFAKDDSNDSNH